MTINFNTEPYYDDYNEDKKFYRILYRPGYAVQARELTQMQTILQKQISRFGDHVFKEGSLVLGGAFDLETDLAYVKIAPVTSFGPSASYFAGKTLVGTTSGLRAHVRAVHTDTTNNNFVLLVRYLSSTEDNTVFLANEVLEEDVNDANFVTVVSSSATGVGSLFTIEEGVVYTKGYFAVFPKQSVVLDPYSATPTISIGFDVVEEIVTPEDDESLFDNAQNTFNFAAPGAHRLAVSATLKTVPYGTGTSDPNFVLLGSTKDGIIEVSKEGTQYARLYEELAKRSLDTSGDYYVRGFGVRTREHLDVANNEGLLSLEKGGDATKLSIDVEPGRAYVQGYEVNNLVTAHVLTDKSTAFRSVNGQIITARTGDYIVVKEVVGSIPLDVGTVVNIYDTAETRVTSRIRNTVSPGGTLIGTARVKAVEYNSGNLGQPEGLLNVYLFDIKMTTGNFSSARALHIGSTFFADIVLTSGAAVLQETNDADLIFPLGSDFTKTVKNSLGNSDTQFYFGRTETKSVTVTNGGTFSVAVSTTNESLGYSAGVLSAAEKSKILISFNADKSFPMAGTVSGTSGASTLTGSSTVFTNLNVGDKITVGGVVYTIASIASNTSLTVVGTLSGTVSGAAYTKTYLSGDVIDLNDKGSSGVVRTVTVVNSSTMNIDLKETNTTVSVDVTVSFLVSRSSAAEAAKQLRADRYVQIDCATLSSLTNPINLGFSDIYRIKSIRKHNSAFTSDSQGTDVTSLFKFDNGQRDSFYSHGTIRASGVTLTTDDHLLVKLDYFLPVISGGFGYFSVDSYPVDDEEESSTTIFTYQIPKYISSTGTTYNLKDVLDFRPILENTATDTTSVTSASTNPAISTTFESDAGGLRIAFPNTNITADYAYYLARRDVVVLSKDNQFNVIKGTPDLNPASPPIPESVMGLATVYIPPYPSISETLARILNVKDNSCVSQKIAQVRYTMREIGVLKNRIDTLEYYNALSILEKNALDLTILDDNGLDRFKNGVFVDGFLDHSLGATTNPDYKIAVDKVEQSIRPRFKMTSVGYDVKSTSGVQVTNSVITLPYTETVLLDQPKATGIRNIEQSVFRFIGTIDMVPDTDVWADTTTVDKTIEFGNDLPNETVMNTEWGSWETYVTGYNVYDRKTHDRTGKINKDYYIGTFSSYADAVAASKNTTYITKDGKITNEKDARSLIETFEVKSREGIRTTINYEKQTEELGNFVTDVSLIPYIKPQVISLYAKGLKAGTRYYVYFDGEDMSDYLTPFVIPEGGVEDATALLAEGSAWRSDEFGDVFGLLRLPMEGKRFRTGTKEVIITDSPTNSSDATSYAKSYFVAQGIAVSKQNTILSTKIAVMEQELVQEFGDRVTQKVKVMGPSCMAYSFKVEAPPGEDGVFLTSVDVFIKEMHPTLGVWFEIREMNSAGGITRTQVPYSEVWMKRNDPRIVLTEDGSQATNVNFEVPVFLYNDTQYAFVIHTEGLNPQTYFWVARLGETDVESGEQVTSRQLTGTLFTTNNNLNYDMVPDVDMKIKFNRASFSTGSGTVTLGNTAQEYLTIDPTATAFDMIGETVYGSERLTFSSLSGAASIIVGDKIIGSDSEVVGSVISISGSNYLTDVIGYTQGESFTVTSSSDVLKDKTGTISVVDRGEGKLVEYNGSTNRITLQNSNGKFYVGSRLSGRQSESTAVVNGFFNEKYSTVNIKPNYLTFANTECSFEKRGFDTTTSQFGNYTLAKPDATSSFAKEKTILSRSQEITTGAIGSSGSSANLRATLSTTSEYVSPVVDVSRAHAVIVNNIINNDATGENSFSGGALENKYISKTITLADGQDAEDLIVILSAYRPENSTIKVWMKIRNIEDASTTESFDDKPWIELQRSVDSFSSSVNQGNFMEMTFNVNPENLDENGVVTYTSNGNTYKGFKQFALKIGLMGTNSALVPRVADLRAIALQK
jgi:hypothetical protein